MDMDFSLDAQATARKDRLAKLRNLKRKQEDSTDSLDNENTTASEAEASTVILSGRNYDTDLKAPKLGYDVVPLGEEETLESRAANIALETRITIKAHDNADKTIDLLSLQPKKPNWDLKRDVDQKLSRLEALTNNAIARIVRDRIVQSQASSTVGHTEIQLGPSENLAEAVKQKENEKDDIIDGEYT